MKENPGIAGSDKTIFLAGVVQSIEYFVPARDPGTSRRWA
jgi:hypothetical protein